jgi:hypothetical protein
MLSPRVVKKLKTKQTPWPESASELYRPSDRRLSAKLMPTFAARECRVVSVTDPCGRILGFLDHSRYFFFQVARSAVVARLSGHRSRPTTSQKIWQLRESNPEPWICSQELWPLDHGGGLIFSVYKFSSYLKGSTIHLRYVARNFDH